MNCVAYNVTLYNLNNSMMRCHITGKLCLVAPQSQKIQHQAPAMSPQVQSGQDHSLSEYYCENAVKKKVPRDAR